MSTGILSVPSSWEAVILIVTCAYFVQMLGTGFDLVLSLRTHLHERDISWPPRLKQQAISTIQTVLHDRFNLSSRPLFIHCSNLIPKKNKVRMSYDQHESCRLDFASSHTYNQGNEVQYCRLPDDSRSPSSLLFHKPLPGALESVRIGRRRTA